MRVSEVPDPASDHFYRFLCSNTRRATDSRETQSTFLTLSAGACNQSGGSGDLHLSDD